MSTATLAGHRVTHARVYIPAWGIPWVEASTDDETELEGRVEMVLADLTINGTVMSGGPAVGRSHFRIAAGAGGWGRVIDALGYSNDLGVKAAVVVQDAARAVGETLGGDLPTNRLGPAWAREEGPAARVLQQVAPEGWYVGEDGITRIGRRPVVDIPVAAVRGPIDRGRDTITLAADSIASIVPGVRVGGLEAVDVLHELAPDTGLRSTLWGRGIAGTSRRLVAMRRLVEQLLPELRYRGLFEYRIVAQQGDRLALQPVRASSGMPDLRRVPVWPGLPGAKAQHTLGARVFVTFADASPARPVVVAFDETPPERIDLATSGKSATEHLATVEATVNMFVNFIYFMAAEDPSTWVGTGKLLDPADTAMANLTTKLSTWLANCANPILPTPGAGGGVLLPTLIAAVSSTLASKANNLTGAIPSIGAPNLRGG